MISMKKISLNTVETNEPDNGLAIDESLIAHPSSPQPFTVQPSKKDTPMKKKNTTALTIIILAIIAGIGTGFGANAFMGKTGSLAGDNTLTQAGSPTDGIKVGDVYGNPNEKDLKDSAEGVVQIGGVDGEGSHHILRPGGPSQTVYLTSSSVDLDNFEGTKVKIWGETFSAQKAGWLMDVQRVKVLELNAKLPTE